MIDIFLSENWNHPFNNDENINENFEYQINYCSTGVCFYVNQNL